MKFFIGILALAAAAAATSPAEAATLTAARPFEIQGHGKNVQVQPLEVIHPGTAKAPRRTVQLYATTLEANFQTAYNFCRSQGWSLASPINQVEQKALEELMFIVGFTKNAWLGSVCAGERWTWLDTNTLVSYNNFVGGAGGPIPPCGVTSDALMMYGPNPNMSPFYWYQWTQEYPAEICHVICQESS